MGGVLTRSDRMIADGRKYVTHMQALVDCYPSSELSDADKQHIFRVLEEHPIWVYCLLFDPKANPNRLGHFKYFRLCALKDPNTQHHYRGRAERIPPDAPPAVRPEAAPSSASASAAAPAPSPHGPAETERPPHAPTAAPEAADALASHSASASSSIAEAPADPALASSESSSSSSAVSSAPVADEADEWTADEELISLLAKKMQ